MLRRRSARTKAARANSSSGASWKLRVESAALEGSGSADGRIGAGGSEACSSLLGVAILFFFFFFSLFPPSFSIGQRFPVGPHQPCLAQIHHGPGCAGGDLPRIVKRRPRDRLWASQSGRKSIFQGGCIPVTSRVGCKTRPGQPFPPSNWAKSTAFTWYGTVASGVCRLRMSVHTVAHGTAVLLATLGSHQTIPCYL